MCCSMQGGMLAETGCQQYLTVCSKETAKQSISSYDHLDSDGHAFSFSEWDPLFC